MPAKTGPRQRKPAQGRAGCGDENSHGHRQDAVHGGNISPPYRDRGYLRVNRPEQNQPRGFAQTASRKRLFEKRRTLFELDAVLE